MEFKGTPGPWTITDSGGSIMDSDQFIIANFRRLAILCRWHEKGFEHFSDEGASKDIGTIAAKANANLIASAPELLSALQGIQESMAKYINIANNIGMDVTADGFYLGHAMEVEEQARAAINKALGRE
ncbi:hypothetical protein HMPREF3119_00410 [Morganella sp. HMSC11D09]|uniref:hypothetical protein n=1 Tax=Morganella TaxID=581 RepID=UPI0005FAC8AC|nr:MULTISPECIES: hypothetical protein [Morganella]KJY06326.1 hypothetical protein Mm0Y_00173 [Morganella morganii]OFV04423.1 hypothetical protein HMPREF3119_00410 [Morganella sp. HMSC11D09]